MKITFSFCLYLYLMLSADVSVVSDITSDSSKKHELFGDCNEYCLEVLLSHFLWCLGMAGIFPGYDCVSAFRIWQPQAAFPARSMFFSWSSANFFKQSSLWIFLDSYEERIGWLLTNFFSETLKSCLVYKEWMIGCPLPLVQEGHLSCAVSLTKTYWHVTEKGNSALSSIFLKRNTPFFLFLWEKINLWLKCILCSKGVNLGKTR